MKVYDLDGNEFEKEPVDVKECVQILGWSTTKPEFKAEEAQEPEVKKSSKKAE